MIGAVCLPVSVLSPKLTVAFDKHSLSQKTHGTVRIRGPGKLRWCCLPDGKAFQHQMHRQSPLDTQPCNLDHAHLSGPSGLLADCSVEVGSPGGWLGVLGDSA